ncbi:MAG: carboxymuconolactone decarboxylase family protein [Phycisphaeraceae bacterium]|nr:carboxymuconolactone decarboxylase family protein [Phycisphaeraceae bacterium]
MPRIQPIHEDQMSETTKAQLEPIRKARGRVINIYATLAHSPAALDYVLAGGKAMSKMSLNAKLREAVTLAIAGVNQCDYCAAAHNAVGLKLGVSQQELTDNLNGKSSDALTQAAIDLSLTLVVGEGNVSDEQLAAARAAGLNDARIVELIVLVAHNLLTNYFNHVAQTDIDFPAVEMPEALSA